MSEEMEEARRKMSEEIDDYFRTVYKKSAENPQWRPGQAFFNVLRILRPDLAEKIRGTAIDPFYTQGAVSESFFAFLEQNWRRPGSSDEEPRRDVITEYYEDRDRGDRR